MNLMNGENNYDYVGMPETVPQKNAKKYFSRIGLSLFLLCGVTTAIQILMQYIFKWTGNSQLFLDLASGTWWFIWLYSLAPMYLIGLPIFILTLPKSAQAPIPTGKISFPKWLAGMNICIPFMFIGNLIGIMISSAFSSENPLENVLAGKPWYVILIFAGIIGPLVEEFIFRKLLIDRLSPYGEGFAVVFSAIIFGIYHGNFSQCFYAAALGLVFGYVYVKTKNVWYSAAMHMIINILGSVVAPLVINDRVAKTLNKLTESPDTVLPEDLLALIPMLLYFAAGFILVVSGIVLFFVFLTKLKLNKGKLSAEGGNIKTALLNPGMIAAAASMILLFVLSLI